MVNIILTILFILFNCMSANAQFGGQPFSTTGGASTLTELSDINTATATAGNMLCADGTDWESISIPDCHADNETLGFNQATQTWTCGDDDGAAGGGDVTDVGDCAGGACFTAAGTGTTLYFEGSTADGIETLLAATDPTGADKTITMPNATGDMMVSGDAVFTDLSDVNTATPTNGNLLIADGTDWESIVMSGDATISSAGALAIAAGSIHDLTVDVKEKNTSAIVKGQAVYVSGSAGAGQVLVGLIDNTNSTKIRALGLAAEAIAQNTTGTIRFRGELSGVDTLGANAVNPNDETWAAGDILYCTNGGTDGGLTNIKPTSGRIIRAGYSLIGSHNSDTILVQPHENPICLATASGEDICVRMGDSAGTNKVYFRNYLNSAVADIDSYGVINGTTLTEGSNAVPNATDTIDFFAGINTATATAGHLLIADGSSWDNITLSGDCTVNALGAIAIVDDSHNHVLANIDEISGGVGSEDLEAEDFGDFTSDGTDAGCTLDADSVATNELSDFGTLTGTLGNILVADGTDFETVTMSGETTITSAGVISLSAFPSIGTDPDVSTVGHIGRDSDNHSLRGYDGTKQFVYGQRDKVICFTACNPDLISEADYLPVWHNLTGFTFSISAIYSTSDVDNATYTLKETTNGYSDHTNLTTIEAITIATNGTGVFYNALTSGIDHTTIETNHMIGFDKGAVDVDFISGCIVGTLDGDVD